MTFKIGLTGGIGSGKSTVAKAFVRLGCNVFNADTISHELSRKGESAYLKITKQFGTEILMKSGEIDRARLGNLIFNNKALKDNLEAILHPLIMRTMHQRADAVDAPYVVMDIPLLIGTPEQHRVNRILVVDCDQNMRINRIKKRNGWSDEKIEVVMSIQTPNHLLLEAADDVIDNNQSIDKLAAGIAELHLKYQKLGQIELLRSKSIAKPDT